MAKRTVAQKMISPADLQYLREQNGLLLRALQDVATGRIEATESSPKSPEGRYTFQLSRAASPSGGIVIVTFHFPGQLDSVTVYDAESLLHSAEIIKWSRACWPAMERLQAARNTIQQGA